MFIICKPLWPSKSSRGSFDPRLENSYFIGRMQPTDPERLARWDEAWKGVEPDQPRPRRTGYYLALAAALFLLIAVCALGYYALQISSAPEPGLTLPASEEAGDPQGVPTIPAQDAGGTPSANLQPAPTVTLPGNFATPSLPPPASDISAPRAQNAPVIDGDPVEWAGLPAYASPHIVFTDENWDGSDDLAASWQVSWDDSSLYLLVTVADDIHSQGQTGNRTYLGDSVELQIDSDRQGDFGPELSPDDFQISLSPGDFAGLPPSAFRFQGTNSGEMLDAPTANSIRVAARSIDSGYVIEASIPWRDVGTLPVSGLVMGLAVNINDNDHPGTAAQEMMKSSAPGRRFRDPTSWGTLTLQ